MSKEPWPPQEGTLVTVLPCNDLDASEAFFKKMGFTRPHKPEVKATEMDDQYRLLANEEFGVGHLHLCKAIDDGLVLGKNPVSLYFYVKDVDKVAAKFDKKDYCDGKGPADQPWGMYEFSLNAPDETCVRVGWPTLLRSKE